MDYSKNARVYSKQVKDSIVAEFHTSVSDACSAIYQKYFIADHIAEGLLENLKKECKRLNSFVKTFLPKGIKVDYPKLRFALSGDTFTITARNSEANSVLKYKIAKSFTRRTGSTNEVMFEEYANWIYDLYEVLLVSALQQKNVDAVNAVLDEITQMADTSYSVHVAIPFGQKGKRLAYVSDDEVVFCVDEDKIFDLDDVAVMAEPGNILSESDIQAAKEAVANEYATAHTVFEFIKNGGFNLINYLCGKTGKSVMTQIKSITKKNMANQSRRVDGLAYYSVDNVFAIVEFKGGNIEVVLSPFNVDTFEKVDVDVMSVAKELPKADEDTEVE